MPADDYFVPGELDALRMENELIGLENTYLKGRIATFEEDLKKALDSDAIARRELRQLREEVRKLREELRTLRSENPPVQPDVEPS